MSAVPLPSLRTGRFERPTVRRAARPVAGTSVRRSDFVLIGCLAAIPVAIVFGITALDVAFACILPVLVTASHDRRVKTLVVLLGAWAAAQVLSDQLNQVRLKTTLGALSPPLLIALAVLGFSWVIRGRVQYALGVAVAILVAQCVYLLAFPSASLALDPWKYGFGPPITLLGAALLGFAWVRGRHLMTYAGLCGLGLLNIVLGFRSFGGITVTAALVMLMSRSGVRLTWKRTVLGLVVVVVAVIGVSDAYGAAATHGLLGRTQQQKYAYQTGTRAGLVLTARPEAFLSAYAIGQSPITGNGSDARLSSNDQLRVFTLMHDYGITVDAGQVRRLASGRLESHSMALGAWVKAGVVGVLPWLYLLWLGGCAVVRRSRGSAEIVRPLLTVWTLSVVWDALFSPWVPREHLMLAAYALLVIVVLGHGERRAPELALPSSGT